MANWSTSTSTPTAIPACRTDRTAHCAQDAAMPSGCGGVSRGASTSPGAPPSRWHSRWHLAAGARAPPEFKLLGLMVSCDLPPCAGSPRLCHLEDGAPAQERQHPWGCRDTPSACCCRGGIHPVPVSGSLGSFGFRPRNLWFGSGTSCRGPWRRRFWRARWREGAPQTTSRVFETLSQFASRVRKFSAATMSDHSKLTLAKPRRKKRVMPRFPFTSPKGLSAAGPRSA